MRKGARNVADAGEVTRLLDVLYEGALDARGFEPFVDRLAAALKADVVVLAPAHGASVRSKGPGLVRNEPPVPESTSPGRVLGPMVLEAATGPARLSVLRSRRRRPFGAEERRLVERLGPHVRCALDLRARAMGLIPPHSLAAAMDSLATGLLVVEGDARIAFANLEAERILASRDGLVVGPSGLRAVHPAADRELRRYLADTRTGAPPAADDLVVPRSSGGGGPPYLVRALPLPADPFQREKRVALLVLDPGRRTGPRPADLTAAFGLSPAQARIAARLCQGERLKDAAAGEGIALETARVHLKAAFRKTATHRQPELIGRLLDAFPRVTR
jgi:DNA-binding CsgD family transcriptional regulator